MAAGPGAQYGKTGGVRAAQSTRREIITRYKQGGYRSKTNYDFGMKSNLRRLNTQKRMLSRSATMDVILGIPINIKLEALQYGILLN